MAKRHFVGILLALTFIVTISVPAQAAQSLNYWYSDKDYVFYTPYDGSYYVYNYSVDAYLAHALILRYRPLVLNGTQFFLLEYRKCLLVMH